MTRVLAADMADGSVTVNVVLPGGRGTRTGMVPDDVPADVVARLQDPAVMGPPIV
jgi:NAD(P)-dependent dehydrogenase (short-subunit alcohol dehydrogenase family)